MENDISGKNTNGAQNTNETSIEMDESNANGIQKNSETNIEPTEVLKKKRVVTDTAYALPSKDSSFDLHMKIIKAYFIATSEGKKAVSYRDFKGLVDFYYGAVSSNNKFFEELGLITSPSRGMYVPTKYALDFQRYKNWGQEDKALGVMRELVKASWFWQSAKQILLMQEGGVGEREILNKLGADSRANPERGHIDSLKILLKYLEYVGFTKRDEKTNKIKMALELVPTESSTNELLTNKIQDNGADNGAQINETNEKQILQPVQPAPAEPIHYREEPGHFTLRVKLEDISIQLLEEEIKYIKGKHALLQKTKKADEEAKKIS